MQYLVSESDLYGPGSFLLYIISLISIFLGVYVIISKNPVISILFLIGLFFSISMYLIIIGLHFLGLSYLLIYIGAVSIFFIFIVMLINIRVSELLTDNKNSIPLAILTVLLFNYTVNDIIPDSLFLYEININNIISIIKNFLSNIIFYFTTIFNVDISSHILDNTFKLDIVNVTSKSWDNIIVTSTHISSIGNILYTNLYILLIIISLILLLSMVGAIVITVNKSDK